MRRAVLLLAGALLAVVGPGTPSGAEPHAAPVGPPPVPIPHAAPVGPPPVPIPHAAPISPGPVPMPRVGGDELLVPGVPPGPALGPGR